MAWLVVGSWLVRVAERHRLRSSRFLVVAIAAGLQGSGFSVSGDVAAVLGEVLGTADEVVELLDLLELTIGWWQRRLADACSEFNGPCPQSLVDLRGSEMFP